MKAIIFFLAIIPFYAVAQDSTKHTLYEGTVVTMTLDRDISSSSVTEGEILQFTTSAPVVIDEYMFAPEGMKVYGKVTDCSKRKGLGKAGKLNFTIDYLTLESGRMIMLNGEAGKKGKPKGGTAVAEAVLLTPFFLLKKGKSAKFSKGQTFQAYIEKDYIL